MKLRQSVGQKQKISATMRNWLPLLQCPITELESNLKLAVDGNPFIEINSSAEVSYEDYNPEEQKSVEDEDFEGDDEHYYKKSEAKNSVTEAIEATTIHTDSLYDSLYDQITDHLFPTPTSKTIAYELIRYINDEGFFEGSIDQVATACGATSQMVESVRKRFEYLTPTGVGAIDLSESFMFQLREYDIDDEVYALIKQFVYDLENLSVYHKEPRFAEAMAIFKKLKNPPAIEFFEESLQVIPDIFVYEESGELEVKLNDSFYPEIIIDETQDLKKLEFVKSKLKEARDLVDAVALRKQTLFKIGLMIVEYQYDFFMGDEIKPMKLADISEDLGRNASTISRAISGKYLACNRGVFPLKSFFSISIDDTSTRAIKEYLQKLIKEEPRSKPLSDQKLLELIEKHFDIKMVRRTITKYREQLEIATSGERKRLYLLMQ